MTDKDAITAEVLAQKLINGAAGQSPSQVATVGYVQANLTQCSFQALVTLLIHKGVITEAEVENAHAEAYRKRAEHTSNRLIVPAAAVARPKGVN